MVVGRQAFPIGIRELFRGELLNFGGGGGGEGGVYVFAKWNVVYIL